MIQVTALDYSSEAIKNINKKKIENYSDPIMADGKSAADKITTKVWDVRNGIPYKDNSFDGCYSHMLYCMALTTSEIIKLTKEVHRILKPGGINIFTVRHTGDGDYKKGKHIGEDLYESDGFIVHFFNKEKIIQISKGFKIEDIFELHEGSFPRKLFVVTQRKKRIWNF